MLYIQFEIQNASKFEDFKNLYNHMVQVRQPGFKFDEEGPEFDWDTMSEEEVDVALKELNTFLDEQVEPEKYRYKALIPDYAKEFLENYIKTENEKSGYFGEPDALPIFNYLEFGFEVDMDHLKKINKHSGIVEFSTGNYPFGGLERFIMTLAAYELKPVACFDGFNKCEIHWTSAFAYESIISTKKNRFSRITEWISNSLFKKSLFLMLFLICNILSAQIDTSACVLNNKIIKTNTKDTFVYVNDVKYTYNQQHQLVKKTSFNEYESDGIDEAVYNNNGQIISQSRFDNTD